MKTEPTETDRAAGAVFVAVPGLRYWRDFSARRDGGIWERTPDQFASYGVVAAIDTDDPATLGCMLAQLRVALDRPGLNPTCITPSVVCDARNAQAAPGWRISGFLDLVAESEGAVMVAAMRMIKPPESTAPHSSPAPDR